MSQEENHGKDIANNDTTLPNALLSPNAGTASSSPTLRQRHTQIKSLRRSGT